MTSRTTISELREELPGGHTDDFKDDRLQTYIRRASAVISDRLAVDSDRYDDDFLGDIETLVAAHFAYPTITGADTGQMLSSEQLGEAQLSYQSDSSAPGNYASPYWDQAVMLAPALDGTSGSAWTVTNDSSRTRR